MQFPSFKDFYPFYLSQHAHPVCRRLHYLGSLLVLICLGAIIGYSKWSYLPVLLLLGYGPAWIGHFFFEKNKPATFKYPIYSFIGDWVMLWQRVRRLVSSVF